MIPRFVYQKCYLYLLLSALLHCERKIAAQQARDLKESYDKLMTIKFIKIKTHRLTGKKLKKPYQRLGNILKGMMVPVNKDDVKWVKQNFRYRRLKGNTEKGHSINAYYLVKKLHYCDEESFFPIKDITEWRPELLIALNKAIENGFRTDKFKELIIGFDIEDVLKEVMGDYYCAYCDYCDDREGTPQPLNHCREETENNWQCLIDNPDDFEEWEEPAENEEILIVPTKSYSNSNPSPRVLIGSLVIIPITIAYKKRRREMKKKPT